MSYADKKDADQPAHPRSLISIFVIHCLDSIIPLVSKSEISSLQLTSVAEQAGLSLTWSQTPKTGFLDTRLIFECIHREVKGFQKSPVDKNTLNVNVNLQFESILMIIRIWATTRQNVSNGCTGWSAPLSFAYDIRHIFSWPGLFSFPYFILNALGWLISLLVETLCQEETLLCVHLWNGIKLNTFQDLQTIFSVIFSCNALRSHKTDSWLHLPSVCHTSVSSGWGSILPWDGRLWIFDRGFNSIPDSHCRGNRKMLSACEIV